MKQNPFAEELLLRPLPNISAPLLAWYDAGARILPWRSVPTPYRVWVSEIMLQQTRVQAALPYFERFMTALPTVEALAAADEDTLHKLWEGLGYYSRVRNLHRAAQVLVRDHGGALPADYQALLSLPGIGEYTAGAIASIAYQLPHPAVDGNVLRVFARLLDCDWDVLSPGVKAAFTQVVSRSLPPDRPGDFNQALMELGATICGPNGPPRCGDCPLERLCLAREAGTAQSLPVKTPKRARRVEERTVLLLLHRGRVLLRRRPQAGLLAGLWELPNLEGKLSPQEAADWAARYGCTATPVALRAGKHIFTHIEWRLSGYLLVADDAPALAQSEAGEVLATARELREQYALPSAFGCYTRELPQLLELSEREGPGGLPPKR